MLPKNFTANKTRTIIAACITLVLGVLFCCSMSFGNGLNYLIGGSLCFAGILFIINSIIEAKALLTVNGFIGFASLSFGIMFMIKHLAQTLIDYVPYLMIAIGVLLFIDAFLSQFVRYNSTPQFIITLVSGAALTTLGFCLMFIPVLQKIAAVVFGCMLIIASLYTLIWLGIHKSKK